MSISQATIVGLPQPQSWDEYERGCLASFGGGYQSEAERLIFRHGMRTVFNLLRDEFPPAGACKAASRVAELELENAAKEAEIQRLWGERLAAIKPMRALVEERDALLAACEDALVAIDAAYESTGHFRVAKTSEQRMRIEAAIAKVKGTT